MFESVVVYLTGQSPYNNISDETVFCQIQQYSVQYITK